MCIKSTAWRGCWTFAHEFSIFIFSWNVHLWPNTFGYTKNPFKNLVYTFFSRSTFFLHQNQMVSVHSSVFSPLPRNMGKWYCLIYLFKIVCIFFKPPRKKNLCSWMFRVNSAFRVGSRMFMFNWTVTVLRLTRAAFEIDLITIYFRN